MKPKISLIIPVYNGARTIEKALVSISCQTFTDFEVIIIDDGSTDNTQKIITNHFNAIPTIRYYHQKNSGAASSRNKGIDLALGDYITFLDSDDFYDKTYFEKMYMKITKNYDDVCYCGYNFVVNGQKKIRKTTFKSGDVLKEYILGKVDVSTNGWMIRNSYLREHNIRFPDSVNWGEDFEFFAEVLASTNKVVFVEEYLTNYRIGLNINSLSSFTLDKLDKDFESINRVVLNPNINKNSKIEKALLNYRLPALLTYRLLEGLERNEDINVLKAYNLKYKKEINALSLNNGLRSIKLFLAKLVVNMKIK